MHALTSNIDVAFIELFVGGGEGHFVCVCSDCLLVMQLCVLCSVCEMGVEG
jgi:hypothetical protein